MPMRKQLILFGLTVIVSTQLARSQQLERSVLSSQGGISSSSSIIMDWTLGEPFIDWQERAGFDLSEGFHQPSLEAILLSAPGELLLPLDVTLYPNPVNEVLNVSVVKATDEKFVLAITDIHGRSVIPQMLLLAGENREVPMGELAPGIYLATLRSISGSRLQTYRVTKMN
jgi:hypothetical protein